MRSPRPKRPEPTSVYRSAVGAFLRVHGMVALMTSCAIAITQAMGGRFEDLPMLTGIAVYGLVCAGFFWRWGRTAAETDDWFDETDGSSANEAESSPRWTPKPIPTSPPTVSEHEKASALPSSPGLPRD